MLAAKIGVISQKLRNEKNKAMMMEVLSKTEEALLLGAMDLQYAEVLTTLYYVYTNNF